MSCELLVVPNGAMLEADELELYPKYQGLASGILSEAEFAAWLRPRLRLQSAGKLQETPVRNAR